MAPRIPVGKLPSELLEGLLKRYVLADPRVLIGPDACCGHAMEPRDRSRNSHATKSRDSLSEILLAADQQKKPKE